MLDDARVNLEGFVDWPDCWLRSDEHTRASLLVFACLGIWLGMILTLYINMNRLTHFQV
jgi:hypothetical protein